jgi:hypothetical protein
MRFKVDNGREYESSEESFCTDKESGESLDKAKDEKISPMMA